MTESNGKVVYICGAIVISALTSTFAFANQVYNKPGMYEYIAPRFGEISGIRVYIVGAGGGGAGGDAGSGRGAWLNAETGIVPHEAPGGGGGGGAFTTCRFYPPEMGNKALVIKISVGAGGKGGMAGVAYDSGGKKGGDGGASSITTVDTNTATQNPVYGTKSGLMAAGGSGGKGADVVYENRMDFKGGGSGGALSVECRNPDAAHISAEPGLSGETGKGDTPGNGGPGRLLEACIGAGAGGKGGIKGRDRPIGTFLKPGDPAESGLPGEDGADGCVILEPVKFGG